MSETKIVVEMTVEEAGLLVAFFDVDTPPFYENFPEVRAVVERTREALVLVPEAAR